MQEGVTSKLDKTSVKDTYSTSTTDTYSCNYVNLIGKTITMDSGGGSTQSIPASTITKVTNTTIERVNQFTNNEITYNNGNYTINSDSIHTILINVQLFFQSSTETYGYIYKNNGAVLNVSLTNIKNRFTFVLPVQKNDVISISCYCASNASLRADNNNFSQITVLG